MRPLPRSTIRWLWTLLAITASCQQLATESGATLTEAQLRYRLAARYVLFYCDPDYWPTARDNEAELALERFPATTWHDNPALSGSVSPLFHADAAADAEDAVNRWAKM
jgi:hypothetical protein